MIRFCRHKGNNWTRDIFLSITFHVLFSSNEQVCSNVYVILCLLLCFQVCSIQTTNRLWHFLFLVGSQLGDEELLGLYFMVNQCARYLERTFLSSDFAPKIWMWCLDSAVGRKVVLVWTLVSTFPHSVHQRAG